MLMVDKREIKSKRRKLKGDIVNSNRIVARSKRKGSLTPKPFS